MNNVKNPTSITVIILGQSCAGKTSLEKRLSYDLGYTPVEIITTRKPREDDPAHYTCISVEEFNKLTDLDYSFISSEDTLYGYRKQKDSTKHIVSIIDSEKCLEYKKVLLSDSNRMRVYILGLSATDEEIMKCYKERGFTNDEIKRRMSVAGLEAATDIHGRDTAYEAVCFEDTKYEIEYSNPLKGRSHV